MWSLIISPEDAERIDLRQHARDFVAGMERDLGTRLEWIAIDHHNTDDAHIHLLIRGVRDDGQVLTLDRDYIMRAAARTQPGADRARAGAAPGTRGSARARTHHRPRAVDRDRPRAGAAGGTDRVVSYENFVAYSEGARVRAEQEIERLAIPREAGSGPADQRTQLGAFIGARTGAAAAPARARHHQEQGPRAAARTRRRDADDWRGRGAWRSIVLIGLLTPRHKRG